MTDPYENDIGMQIARANSEGDIAFLKEMSDTGKFDPCCTTDSAKWNYLHMANMNSYSPAPLSTMHFYLDKGVEVNAQDCYGMTPLHYAMQAKNGDAALALLDAGANPNIPNRDNVIPLGMMGAMPHRLDVLKKMLENGGDVWGGGYFCTGMTGGKKRRKTLSGADLSEAGARKNLHQLLL